MLKNYLFLLFVGLFLNANITNAQTASINSDFTVSVSDMNSGSYIIDISNAGFTDELEAQKVFDYYERHPSLDFTLDFANSQVTLDITTSSISRGGSFDVSYLNNVLNSMSLGYHRKFD